MQEPEVVAAIIGASVSLVLAVFSLLTARAARAHALAAEDATKQTELVRAKGLGAVEEVTFAIGKLLEVIRTMHMMLVMRGSLSARDLIENFNEPRQRFTEKFIDAYYRHLVYFDDRLTAQFYVIRESLIHQPTTEEGLKEQFEGMRRFLEAVSALARERYLPASKSA
jgi:hypothetical protein